VVPVSLSSRRRDRKARKLARLLVALDRASGEQRSPLGERRRAAIGLGRAA
jgi:hypothetical protein